MSVDHEPKGKQLQNGVQLKEITKLNSACCDDGIAARESLSGFLRQNAGLPHGQADQLRPTETIALNEVIESQL